MGKKAKFKKTVFFRKEFISDWLETYASDEIIERWFYNFIESNRVHSLSSISDRTTKNTTNTGKGKNLRENDVPAN